MSFRELAPEVTTKFFVIGDLLQLVNRPVSGEGEEPTGGILDIGELFPTLPDLEEDLLGDLFGDGFGLGCAEDQAVDPGAIVVEKNTKSMGIPFRNLMENTFF